MTQSEIDDAAVAQRQHVSHESDDYFLRLQTLANLQILYGHRRDLWPAELVAIWDLLGGPAYPTQ